MCVVVFCDTVRVGGGGSSGGGGGGERERWGGWGTTDKIASLIAASIITLQLSSAVALPVSHLECTHTSRRRTAGTHGCALSYREDAIGIQSEPPSSLDCSAEGMTVRAKLFLLITAGAAAATSSRTFTRAVAFSALSL